MDRSMRGHVVWVERQAKHFACKALQCAGHGCYGKAGGGN